MATRMFKITGYKHSDELVYPDWDKDHEFPDRKLIHESATEFEGEFKSMDEASLWLLTYHPEYYIGHGVHALDGTNDFKCTCVPGGLYNAYETTDDNEVLLKEYQYLVRQVHFNDYNEIECDDPADWNDDYLGDHESHSDVMSVTDEYCPNDGSEGDFDYLDSADDSYWDDGCPIDDKDDFYEKNYDDEFCYELRPDAIFDSAGEPILI